MTVIYQYSIPTSSSARPFKIYPNLYFWSENLCTIWQPWWQCKTRFPERIMHL
jgi:hypothetical protein